MFAGLGATTTVLLTHGDSVSVAARGFSVVARSQAEGIVAGIADESRGQFGVQFHPEVDLTKEGTQMFSNFLDFAQFKRTFTIPSRMHKAVAEIQVCTARTRAGRQARRQARRQAVFVGRSVQAWLVGWLVQGWLVGSRLVGVCALRVCFVCARVFAMSCCCLVRSRLGRTRA